MLSIGIPLLRLEVCSESEVTFTCIVNESETLSWDIDFSSGQDIERVNYLSTDKIYQNLYAINRGTGIEYHFNLTSKSPFTSTMTTDTPTDLSGARVLCYDEVQSSPSVLMLPSKAFSTMYI